MITRKHLLSAAAKLPKNDGFDDAREVYIGLADAIKGDADRKHFELCRAYRVASEYADDGCTGVAGALRRAANTFT